MCVCVCDVVFERYCVKRCTLLAWTEHQLSCDTVFVDNKGHQERPRSGCEFDDE